MLLKLSVNTLSLCFFGLLADADYCSPDHNYFSTKRYATFYLYILVFVQLYMETIQDLLDPANDSIPIVEDQKTGDVSLPGATVVEIRDQQSFLELLRVGEAHRYAANTKLNTESSRSHAILLVSLELYISSFQLNVLLSMHSSKKKT